MTIILAVFSGLGWGYIIERGDLCFHSTLRGLVRVPRQLDLFRAYVLAILVAIPLVTVMRALGWIDPWVPPFAWSANIVGGCNLGHSLIGVPLLSMGSITTTIFMAFGVWVADRMARLVS